MLNDHDNVKDLLNDNVRNKKKLTTLGIPRRSPIQVLTEPDVA